MKNLKPLLDGIIENRPAKIIPDYRIKFIEKAVKPIAERKAREKRYKYDGKNIVSRYGCGLFGEIGIEELFNIVYCDTSVGHTIDYSVPDLRGIGLEISNDFAEKARKRPCIQDMFGGGELGERRIYTANAKELFSYIEKESVDLVVTSPPYWDILLQERTADNK